MIRMGVRRCSEIDAPAVRGQNAGSEAWGNVAGGVGPFPYTLQDYVVVAKRELRDDVAASVKAIGLA